MTNGFKIVTLFHIFVIAMISLISCTKTRKTHGRPNIVLFLTDDQDTELGSMEFMPKTLKIFRQEGVEFVNGFVSTPICCPSRSSILTGLYVHNHHVHSNNENCTGQGWQTTNEPKTFAPFLHKSGYKTGYFGKYLNEYNGSYVPPGWDEWMGLVKNSRFYNYTISYNGAKIKHASSYAEDYFTDLIVNDSLSFFKREYRRHSSDKPFLLVLSFPAPHGPEDPAPQYSSMFANVTSHRTPSWNYAPNPDKQWILQHTGKMEPVHVAFTDFLQRRRLQTLQSVDDAVHKVYKEMKDLGELDNTFFMYTSDHGYHLGQFGLIKGKSMPYDFDLKVPYFVRGPGVVANSKIRQPVLNIDIAPTILDMGGVPAPNDMDGRSILPLIRNDFEKAAGRKTKQFHWRHTVLIERGLRPKLIKLRERLRKQNERYSKELRIQKECEREEYQPPCKENQLWECRKNEVDRWRIFKCRGDVSVQKDCQCEDEELFQHFSHKEQNRAKKHRSNGLNSRRGRRSTTANETKILSSTSANVKLSDFESGLHGDTAEIAEETLEQWENEFFAHILQKEVVEGGGWYQGIFDALEDEIENECLIPEEEDCILPARSKRSAANSNRQTKKENFNNNRQKDSVIVRGCSLYANHTVQCRREVYTNMDDWRHQKHKLDFRIRNLRHKLQEMIGIRRHLKEERPETSQLLSRDASFWDPLPSTVPPSTESWREKNFVPKEKCKCDNHPLKHSTKNFNNEISDVELLAFAEERQKSRQNRKGKGRKGVSNGGSEVEKRLQCNVPNLNCFTHDNHHWKTPPYWTLGPFCFCQNSNNNTYWCLRTVNATHDFLYCEFVTGFVSFYDMTKDRYQLHNIVYKLSYPVLEKLSFQLEKLRNCKGAAECERFGRSV